MIQRVLMLKSTFLTLLINLVLDKVSKPNLIIKYKLNALI